MGKMIKVVILMTVIVGHMSCQKENKLKEAFSQNSTEKIHGIEESVNTELSLTMGGTVLSSTNQKLDVQAKHVNAYTIVDDRGQIIKSEIMDVGDMGSTISNNFILQENLPNGYYVFTLNTYVLGKDKQEGTNSSALFFKVEDGSFNEVEAHVFARESQSELAHVAP